MALSKSRVEELTDELCGVEEKLDLGEIAPKSNEFYYPIRPTDNIMKYKAGGDCTDNQNFIVLFQKEEEGWRLSEIKKM